MRESRAALDRVRKQAKHMKRVREKWAEEQRVFEWWGGGFRQFRLELMRNALMQFELETNNALHLLGLRGWYIRYGIDQEQKNGRTRKGFSVGIEAPGLPRQKKVVPWEAWSGGESQRLRIAAAMGLASLIRSRMGIRCNVEIWDEPSTWLSKPGIEMLLNALWQRAQQEDRQIWLVDHRSLEFGQFAGRVTVVKTRDGSSLEEG
jgi:DNA repair exonuclease SbcCD ATPase subunit